MERKENNEADGEEEQTTFHKTGRKEKDLVMTKND